MLIFNEGVPGAGKTYDAIVMHLLPALKRGRKVYARINGLDHDKIAEYLGIDPADVRANLHLVKTDDIRKLFRAERDADGELIIPEQFRNALILIDEAHEFYVASREAMEKDEEQFFAIHRHYGMDIVLMTQWYKRLHTALRARIERKNVFQKLTAVGLEKSYRVTFWHTVSPDKYEKVGAETRKYRPEHFPLYKGVAGDEVQTEVYKAGGRTVWATLAIPTLIFVPILGFSIYWLWGFFKGDGGWAGEAATKPVASAPVRDSAYYQPDDDAPRPKPQAAAKPVAEVKPDPVDKMTAEQQYIWRMAKSARARVSAVIGEGESAWGLIEFREKNQKPMEVITTRQLQAMGIEVTPRPFGFMLRAAGEVIVATAWPTGEPERPANHELYRLDVNRGGPAPFGSEATNGAGPRGIPGGRSASTNAGDWGIADYGDFGQQTGNYVGQGISR